MEDSFEKFCNEHLLAESSILHHVDDYTLFIYYTGITNLVVNQAYISPLRPDDTRESFSVFYDKEGNLRFYDFGTRESGNVFRFISLLYGISRYEVLKLINTDFGLGFNGQLKKAPPIQAQKPLVRKSELIRITPKPFTDKGLAYWRQFYITEALLHEYGVMEVSKIHYGSTVVRPSGLAFAYKIGGYYKIYQPYSRKYKFSSNFPRNYVEGYLQLKYNSDKLIITKSMKDVMCLRVLGFEAVSPKSENTPIVPQILQKLESRYKHIYTLFDNDSAGRRGADLYEYKQLYYSLSKDTSDHLKDWGINKTRLELIKMLYD